MNWHFVDEHLNTEKIEHVPMRNGAGDGMAALGAVKKDMVVVAADTAGSSRAKAFGDAFPERFVQCGVAEQNMIGVSAGLAYQGKVPYAVTYAAFLIGRAWEPIRTTIAYPQNHVVLVSSHAGIATGSDGPTHQMTEDIALMAALPNFTVLAPCDAAQAEKAVHAAYEVAGPVYIRTAREKTPLFTTEKTPFDIGVAQVLREGSDLTLIGHGYVVHSLLRIAEELADTVSCEVINLHTIWPVDEEAIVASAKKTGRVFTAEDHNVVGGMGSIVASVLARKHPVPVYQHGILHTFAESGSAADLWKKYKLDVDGIRDEIKTFLA